ncbi:MAG TPA: hypothetical protein VK988_11260 [Acidimicrobiales bacterium]|nr:hypothetical protein [Acidimicrobiales bacterium]
MDACSALDFGEISRLVAGEARRHGLVGPSFRSPPRLDGVTRSIRRYPNGQWLVSVRCRGRSVADVAADMVDGVLLANGLDGAAAEGWRITLRAACLGQARSAA